MLETTPLLKEKCLTSLQPRPSALTSSLTPPKMNSLSLSESTAEKAINDIIMATLISKSKHYKRSLPTMILSRDGMFRRE